MSGWKPPDPTPLPRDFHESRTFKLGEKQIAVALFRGEAAATHELLHVFAEMNRSIVKLMKTEQRDGVILDLRELKYSKGDEMTETLCKTWECSTARNPCPVVVIVSDLNRDGLTSLVRDDMMANPAEWLTETEEEAIAWLQTMLESLES